MINATTQTLLRGTRGVATSRRLTLPFFWSLFGALALVMAFLIAMLLSALPSHTPLTAGADIAIVREAITTRLNGAIVDPRIEVLPGVLAPASQVRGLEPNGKTYYYYYEGGRNFDPLSLGTATAAQAEILLHDRVDSLVIYRLYQ